MWPSIVGFFASVGSAIAKLLSALVQWAAVVGAYFLGKRSEQKKQAEKAVEIKDEQLEAAARPPRRKSGIIKRMMDGDL